MTNFEKLGAFYLGKLCDPATLETSASPVDLDLTEVSIRPRKADIAVSRVALAWTPWRVGRDGGREPWHV